MVRLSLSMLSCPDASLPRWAYGVQDYGAGETSFQLLHTSGKTHRFLRSMWISQCHITQALPVYKKRID
jgi:hypothetical protein